MSGEVFVTSTSRLDNVISLCKRRGFVFPAGEIYGGTRSAWDYGPLGVELKENVKKQWWRSVVTEREDIVGLDSSVILPRRVWVASGHLNAFNDPLTECLSCHRDSEPTIWRRISKRGRAVSPPVWTRSPVLTAALAASGPSRGTST